MYFLICPIYSMKKKKLREVKYLDVSYPVSK